MLKFRRKHGHVETEREPQLCRVALYQVADELRRDGLTYSTREVERFLLAVERVGIESLTAEKAPQ